MYVTIKIKQTDSHVHLDLFVNHALAGSLVLRAGEEFKDFCNRMDPDEVHAPYPETRE